MNPVVPPVPPQAIAQAVTSPQPVTATVPNPPQALLNLPVGARLDAVVTEMLNAPGGGPGPGGAPKGAVVVQTSLGTFTLQLALPLGKGTKIELAVQSQSPAFQVVVAGVGGKPMSPALLQFLRHQGVAPPPPAPSGQPVPQPTVQPTVAGASPPAAQPVLTATVLRGVPPGASGPLIPAAPSVQAPVPAPAAPTAPASAVPQAPLPSASAPAVSAPPAPGAAPSAQGTVLAPSSPAAGAEAARGLIPGTKISFKVLPALGDGSPLPGREAAIRTPAVGTVVQGTVIGSTRQGQPLVQTPLGLIAVDGRAAVTGRDLPVGGRVALELAAAPKPPVPGSGGPVSPWPTLGEALEVLKAASPQAAGQAMAAITPQPGGGLAANIMFFLAALRGGDMRTWLGEPAARVLDRERPGLLGRLAGDLPGHSARAADGQGGEWRVTAVPLHTGAALSEIRLAVRDRPDEDTDDGQEGRGGVRFLFDLTLSRVGRMQLDGLSRPEESRLNLIVRTGEVLAPELRRGINGAFTEAVERVGLAGQLVFQVSRRFVELDGRDLRPLDPLGLIV